MKILMVVDHGVAARYMLDVASALHENHELYCCQFEDDFADYWFEGRKLPFNNVNINDKFDVYITSGTSKCDTKYDPKYVKARKKIFMCEPVTYREIYHEYDTVLLASEYAKKRLCTATSQKIIITGYPPFENAVNCKRVKQSSVLILSDWYYEKEPSQHIVNTAITKHSDSGLELVVKPHPYQKWRTGVLEEEARFLKQFKLTTVNANLTDPFEVCANASVVYCIMSIAGMESTLMDIPTYFFRSPEPVDSWGFQLDIQTFERHEHNKKILLNHYKTENVVRDIVRAIES